MSSKIKTTQLTQRQKSNSELTTHHTLAPTQLHLFQNRLTDRTYFNQTPLDLYLDSKLLGEKAFRLNENRASKEQKYVLNDSQGWCEILQNVILFARIYSE